MIRHPPQGTERAKPAVTDGSPASARLRESPGHSQRRLTSTIVSGEVREFPVPALPVQPPRNVVAGADLEPDLAEPRAAGRRLDPVQEVSSDAPSSVERMHGQQAEVGLLDTETHDREARNLRSRPARRFRHQHRRVRVEKHALDAARAPRPAKSVLDVVPSHPSDYRSVRLSPRPMRDGDIGIHHPVTILHSDRCWAATRVEVKETVIRRMTRLAVEHGAVNLSQGFTDEAPVFDMVWGGVAAMIGGTQDGVDRIESMTLREILESCGSGGNSLELTLKELLAGIRNPRDQLNQYSFPFGIPELRHAIADYTAALYGYRPDPEEQITVVLGASEGMAVAFRSLLAPGDGVLVMQPYHELYPSQAAIFGLVPSFVTLREDRDAGTWRFDRDEVRAAASAPSVKAIVVNSPQNPTGKVLDEDELSFVAALCREHDLFAITDDIYEHITFDGHRHRYLPSFEGMADRTLVVNSISKTGRSTGWRIGWVISPPERTRLLRAVHDNLVVQAPTPLQKGAVALLRQKRAFFDGIAGDYLRKRDFLVEGLRSVGFTATPPEGAYYLFADYRSVPSLAKMSPIDAAMHLVEEIGVATVPGDNFYGTGNDGHRYLRFAFCRSLEALEAGIERLRARL